MSDESATPVEGAASAEPAATPETAPASEPWAPVVDRVNELAGTLDSRLGALEQRIPQPQPEPEPDPWQNLYGQPEPEEQYFDQYGNPVEFQQQAQPSLDVNALQQAVQQQVQQATGPLLQQLQDLQMERGREQLLQKIPELQDPEFANKAIQNITQGLAAAQAPPEIAGWISNNPWMIEQLVKAAEAEKLAQAQTPASNAVPALEAAGGAAPSGTNDQPNYVQAAMTTGYRLPPGLA